MFYTFTHPNVKKTLIHSSNLFLLSYITNHFSCTTFSTRQQHTLGHCPAIYSLQSVLLQHLDMVMENAKCMRHIASWVLSLRL